MERENASVKLDPGNFALFIGNIRPGALNETRDGYVDITFVYRSLKFRSNSTRRLSYRALDGTRKNAVCDE